MPQSMIRHPADDAEYTRARKRQRIDGHSSTNNTRATSSPTMFPSTDRNIRAALSDPRASMRPTQSDHDSSLSVSLDSTLEAGPSSIGLPGSGAGPSNGHANGNGFTLLPAANGSSSGAIANGSQRYGRSMAKVLLPGTALYDDSYIDREEYIRLVIQSLRDVGYKCVVCPSTNPRVY
jgi:hypothetical protein